MQIPRERREELRSNFGLFVQGAGNNPDRLLGLAKVARELKLMREHDELLLRASAVAEPGSVVAQAIRHRLNQRVPNWHFPMMSDGVRNAAFDTAIRAAVRPGDRVLDIGSGSGLLAMMAARAGASQVVSCEVNPIIAAMAAEIVALNGYSDTVRVLAKASSDLDPETDLGGPVDVIVCEILSDNLVAESVQETLEDATRRLLKPGGKLVPVRGDIMVALAEFTELTPVEEASGFDVRPFNRLRPGELFVPGAGETLQLRSAPATLFSFDFAEAANWRSRTTELAPVSTGGRINGIVQWLRIDLDGETRYENEPGPDFRSCWSPRLHPFDEPIEPPAGTPVAIAANHDEVTLAIWLAGN